MGPVVVRRRGRRSVAFVVGLLVALALAACSSGGGVGSAGSTAGSDGTSLHWGSCERSYEHSYTCAKLSVPLDPARPAGTQITIALIRTKATGKKIGSLLLNPGGPGVSSLAAWDSLSGVVSDDLHKRFDVIGFDPRGVGDSTSVHCTDARGLDAYTSLDFDPRSAVERQTLLAGAQRLAQGCAAQSGSLLPYVGTTFAAADMDRIRAALGETKLTYLGFSYGTFLGAEYAHQFPDRVRGLVLDGALDPSEPAIQGTIEQSVGFQRQLDRFLADCEAKNASKRSCGWKFTGDAHAALRALVAKVDAAPVPARSGRELASGQLFFGIAFALYDEASWPTLAKALQAVSTGDGSALLALSDSYNERDANGSYSNSIEANLAINCRDYPTPQTPDAAFAAAADAGRSAPDFGAANMNLGLACLFLPPSARGTALADPSAPSAPPILVVATTGDPATPYSQGVSLARKLGSGVLVTNVGEQHTAYGYSACVTKIVDAYLTDLTVPPAGTRCDDE